MPFLSLEPPVKFSSARNRSQMSRDHATYAFKEVSSARPPGEQTQLQAHPGLQSWACCYICMLAVARSVYVLGVAMESLLTPNEILIAVICNMWLTLASYAPERLVVIADFALLLVISFGEECPPDCADCMCSLGVTEVQLDEARREAPF